MEPYKSFSAMWKLHRLAQIYPRQKASYGNYTESADLSEELKSCGDCTKDADLSEVEYGRQLTYRYNEERSVQPPQEDPNILGKPAIVQLSLEVASHTTNAERSERLVM